MSKFKIGSRTYRLPRSRLLRTVGGLALILGGVLGFLPVLGFWMVPLGILVLSVDWPLVRRIRRRFTLWWGRQGRNNRFR